MRERTNDPMVKAIDPSGHLCNVPKSRSANLPEGWRLASDEDIAAKQAEADAIKAKRAK